MAQPVIDLRSDTVTHPTAAMRQAMAESEVGDDQYGDDPTVNRLEARAAEMLGKEAAVFVASGTMGNLAAVLTHCGRGQEVVMGSECHIFHYESGGTATLGGLPWHVLPNTRMGRIDTDAITGAIRGSREGHPITGVLCLENTHNRCGGVAIPAADIKAMADIAHAEGGHSEAFGTLDEVEGTAPDPCKPFRHRPVADERGAEFVGRPGQGLDRFGRDPQHGRPAFGRRFAGKGSRFGWHTWREGGGCGGFGSRHPEAAIEGSEGIPGRGGRQPALEIGDAGLDPVQRQVDGGTGGPVEGGRARHDPLEQGLEAMGHRLDRRQIDGPGCPLEAVRSTEDIVPVG